MAFSETVPPNDLKAEMAVLGAILVDPTVLPTVRTELTEPRAFYADKHKVLYEALLRLADRGSPVDLVTIEDTMGTDRLMDIGGFTYLTSMMHMVPTTANVAEYAKIVKRKYGLRQQVEAGMKIAALARQADEDTAAPDEAAARARADAEAVLRSAAAPTGKGALEPIAGISLRARDRLAKMGEPDPKRIEWGLKEFDRYAWRSGEILALHAPSGNGKSTTLRAMLLGAAKKGHRCALFSLENDQDQIEEGLIAAEGRLSLHRIRNKDRDPLTNEEVASYEQAADRIDTLPLLVDYVPQQKMHEIRAKCLAAAMQHGGLSVIAIDYAAIVGDTPESWQRHEQMLTRLHYEAQWLAREVGAFVIMVDQAPTDMLTRADPTPTIADFSDSRSIPRAVDHAIGLIVPSQCKSTGADKRKVIPAFPVPKGDPIPHYDRRWENVILGCYTKGRYSGSGFLLPLYHDAKCGYVGNLQHRPWESPDGLPGQQGDMLTQLHVQAPAPSPSRPRAPEPKDSF